MFSGLFLIDNSFAQKWSRWESLDSPSYVHFREPVILWQKKNMLELFVLGDDGELALHIGRIVQAIFSDTQTMQVREVIVEAA